jgi:phage/plasmid-associated DNA primase
MNAERIRHDAGKPYAIGPMEDYVWIEERYSQKSNRIYYVISINAGPYIVENIATYKELQFIREGITVKPLLKQEFNKKIKTLFSTTYVVYPVGVNDSTTECRHCVSKHWKKTDLDDTIFDNLEKLPDVQDGSNHIGQIVLKNGVLDLKTQTLTPHEKDFVTFSYVPVEYNPDATCPETMKAMKEIFEPDQLEAWMSLMGARLTGLPMQYIVALHGEGGQGKGVVRDHTTAFFGNMLTQAPMEDVNARFRNQSFIGAKIVWNSEIPATKQIADIMNNISGGMTILVEAKGKDGIMKIPIQALVCIDVNLLAALPDSYSTKRRLQYFQMSSKFTDAEEPGKRIFKKDIEVIAKITTDEELSGWLNQLLPYAKHYLNTKQLYRVMGANLETFNEKADSIDTFLARYTIIDYNERTHASLLKNAYVYFCAAEKNGAKPWYSMRKFLRDNLNVRPSGHYLQNLVFNKTQFLDDYPGAWTTIRDYRIGG